MDLTPDEHSAIDTLVEITGVTSSSGFEELFAPFLELTIDGPDDDGFVWLHGRIGSHLHSVTLGSGELGAAALAWWRGRG